MPRSQAPKSFKKFARNELKDTLKDRSKRRMAKRQMKERTQKRKVREEKEDKAEDTEHLKTIQDLKRHDPELHKYLEVQEPDVLQFGMDLEGDDDAEEDEEVQAMERETPAWAHEDVRDSGDEDDPDDEAAAQDRLTAPIFQSWLDRRRLKMVGLAFRAAIALLENDGERVDATPHKWRVTEPELASTVIAGAMKGAAGIMDHYAKRSSKKNQHLPPEKCPGFPAIRDHVKTFLCTTTRALRCVEESTLLTVILNSCLPLCPYLGSWMGLKRAFLKRFLALVAHDVEPVRFQAFLNIRALAKTFKYPFNDLCMKSFFLTFARATKTFTRVTLPVVSFLMNGLVVLWGEDLTAAYQQAFMYIRQLATYLRTALKSQSQENFLLVYNWQYINSFRALAMVVGHYLKPSELWPLVYPLCQIGLGVLDLFPSPKCFPLHLNVIGILNRLARASGVYVPVPPYLLRILSSPEFRKRYRKVTQGIAPDLICTLRSKSNVMHTVTHQSTVLREALYYLVEHLAQHAHCIGFPELAYPSVATLAKVRKNIQMYDWKHEVKEVLLELERNVTFIQDRRKNVLFGPKDSDKVAVWETETKAAGPPLVKYYDELHEHRGAALQEQGRVQQATQRRRTLEDAMAAQQKAEEEEGEERSAQGDEDGEEGPAKKRSKKKAGAKKAAGGEAKSGEDASKDIWNVVGERSKRRKGRTGSRG